MSKVTSKLQVTIPKRIAERHGVSPGDEIDWESAGEVIRIVPRRRMTAGAVERLRRFDEATERQRRREELGGRIDVGGQGRGRGWTREDLYEDRGLPR